MTAIDETDQRILTMLEADGRATLAQLAQATGLSVSAAAKRCDLRTPQSFHERSPRARSTNHPPPLHAP